MELINKETRWWNISLIHEVFKPMSDSNKSLIIIRRIIKLIWRCKILTEFSIQSTYQLAGEKICEEFATRKLRKVLLVM